VDVAALVDEAGGGVVPANRRAVEAEDPQVERQRTAGGPGGGLVCPRGLRLDAAMELMDAEPTGTVETGREISREIVGLFKKYVGRGPTYARTYVHEELVVTVLHDTMTRGEQTLKEEDEEEKLRELRKIFQGAFREEAVSAIERATGRRVIAFLSDHAVEPDWSAEVFVLERTNAESQVSDAPDEG
jgi:uncharacterized protein YbcI